MASDLAKDDDIDLESIVKQKTTDVYRMSDNKQSSLLTEIHKDKQA